jgi:hypothetical protein
MNPTKQKTIEHYERMIKWAEGQDGEVMHALSTMRKTMTAEIGENWYGYNCDYCKIYGTNPPDCGDCPLSLKQNCCGGLWDALIYSATWTEWIIAAKAVLEFIKENG